MMLWYLKQLLPLTYRTKYVDANGQQHFVSWKMFLGRCFGINDQVIKAG